MSHELESAIERLQLIRRGYRIHSRYLVSDLVILGYIQEAVEHALAVLALAASPVPHRSIPNARTVFEAAQYSLLLVTHADYAYAGALAWVYQLRKDHKLQDELEALGYAAGVGAPRGLALAVDEMEETWTAYAPESRGLLARAQRELEERGRSPDNWLGRNAAVALEGQLAHYSASSGKNLPLPKTGTFKTSYATLCRGAHPQLSVRPKLIRGTPGGQLTVLPDERLLNDYAEMAIGFAKSAVDYVCLAVAIRSHLDPAT